MLIIRDQKVGVVKLCILCEVMGDFRLCDYSKEVSHIPLPNIGRACPQAGNTTLNLCFLWTT